jgi:trehalose utilization protein
MATTILKPTAPNLPIAPQQYSSQYGEQLNNVLRLYFNQLSNAVGTLITTVNTIEDEVATLQAEVAALEAQAASAQTLIWLDM